MLAGIRYVFAGIPTKQFVILYIMHSLASFLRSDRDLYPNVWSISVTLEVLWWRCRLYRAAQHWIISSWLICVKVKGSQTVVLVRYQKYRSIAILAKVRYRYLVVSRYFDIFGIERPLFDTFDTFDTYDTFDISILDIESIRRSRCEGANSSLLMTTLFTGAITTALRSLN